MPNPTTQMPHNLIMEGRRNLRISGVKDIDSFTDTRIILDTVQGELVIKGQDLHVISLDAQTGDFTMTGEVCGINYNRDSILANPVRKLFR